MDAGFQVVHHKAREQHVIFMRLMASASLKIPNKCSALSTLSDTTWKNRTIYFERTPSSHVPLSSEERRKKEEEKKENGLIGKNEWNPTQKLFHA